MHQRQRFTKGFAQGCDLLVLADVAREFVADQLPAVADVELECRELQGVERTFQTYSPLVDSLAVKRRGDVRKAKLYYLRDLSGKAARIKEKLG